MQLRRQKALARTGMTGVALVWSVTVLRHGPAAPTKKLQGVTVGRMVADAGGPWKFFLGPGKLFLVPCFALLPFVKLAIRG